MLVFIALYLHAICACLSLCELYLQFTIILFVVIDIGLLLWWMVAGL